MKMKAKKSSTPVPLSQGKKNREEGKKIKRGLAATRGSTFLLPLSWLAPPGQRVVATKGSLEP
jgi:hypothetical protein